MNLERKCGLYTQRNIIYIYKKNEIIPYTAKWIQLEDIILNEISKTQKKKSHVNPDMSELKLFFKKVQITLSFYTTKTEVEINNSKSYKHMDMKHHATE